MIGPGTGVRVNLACGATDVDAHIPDTTLIDWGGRAMRTLHLLIERIETDIMGE